MSTFSLINQCRSEYSENLFSTNSVINNNSVIIKGGGSVTSTIEKNTDNFFEKYHSLKAFNDNSSTPLNFYVQDGFNFTTNNDGNYILSIRVFHKQVTPYNHKLKVNLFANGIYTTTFELGIEETPRNEWLTFAQNINISSGVDIGLSFDFEIAPSDPAGECNLWIGGVKIEYDDRNLGIPSVYSLPRSYYENTAWESKSDTTNIISLTGGSNTLFSLTATSESNGGLTFLTNVSKVQPILEGDAIVVDLAFTAITPAGSNNYIEISFVVNGFVYGAQTISLLKGAGNDDYIRVSFGLPVSEDFWLNGGEFYLKSNVDLDIKNRYISVVRTHKAR